MIESIGSDNGKIPSNFLTDYPTGDNFQPLPLSRAEAFGADDEALSMMLPQIQEKPKDYKAMSEGILYERLSENGAVKTMEVIMNMIDDNNGSGKAMITIGSDAKKRQFEVPISVHDGKVKIDKAVDMDSNKVINIGSSTKELFDPPDKKIVEGRLQETYDKYKDFFKHKPKERHIDALVKRWPSVTRAEAEQFLNKQYNANKPKLYQAWNVVKKRKNIAIGITIGLIGAIVLIRLMMKNGESSVSDV